MSPLHWINHPGRNPAHRFGEGRPRWKRMVPDPRTGKDVELVFLGPKIVNRWLPHQGKRECARRLARLSATPTQQKD